MRKFRLVACVLLAAPICSLLVLEASSAAQSQPPVLRLEPKEMAGVDQGKAVVVKGAAGTTEHRFVVDQLTYQMPVAVALRPVRKGDEVNLKVTKYAWNQPLRAGSTDGDLLRYVFRTEGEFQIAVDAKKAQTPYRLMVWVGDETKPEFTPVVVKASEHETQRSGFSSVVLWVIAVALILIVILLGALVMKRRTT